MNSISDATKNNGRKQGILGVRSLTVIAMLSAISVILMLFEIPLWFAPNFYEIDFSEVPVLIGSFAIGPMAGVIIEAIKILLNFMINGTITAGIGELANFIIGCSLVVPSALVYKKMKSKKGAILGMVIGTILMVVLGAVLNAYLLLPVYASVFGIPLEQLVGMGTAVNANIHSVSTLILFAVVPFNLVKGVLVTLITVLLYKYISPIIKNFAR